MDNKDKYRNVKNKMFFLITRENVTKKHDESLSFDYLIQIYIYMLPPGQTLATQF